MAGQWRGWRLRRTTRSVLYCQRQMECHATFYSILIINKLYDFVDNESWNWINFTDIQFCSIFIFLIRFDRVLNTPTILCTLYFWTWGKVQSTLYHKWINAILCKISNSKIKFTLYYFQYLLVFQWLGLAPDLFETKNFLTCEIRM